MVLSLPRLFVTTLSGTLLNTAPITLKTSSFDFESYMNKSLEMVVRESVPDLIGDT